MSHQETNNAKQDAPLFFGCKMFVMIILLLGMNGVVCSFYGVELDAVLILSSIFLCIIGNTRILKSESICLLFITFYFIVSSIMTNTSFYYYFGFLIRIIGGVLVITAFNHDYKAFRAYLNKGLWIICYFSLFNFILYTFVPSFFSPREFPSGRSFFSIAYIFNYIVPEGSETIIRNQGPFGEPGVLQIFLNMLLIDELILKNRPFRSVWLPITLIITTFSTTGFILMFLIIGWKIFASNKDHKKLIKRIIVLLFFVSVFLPIAMVNFENKFVGEGSVSSALRYYDLAMGIKIIADNPLWGIGMEIERYFKYNSSIYLDLYSNINPNLERGNSNTLMMIGMHLGLPALLLYIFAIAKENIYPCRILFFLFYIIACSTEPILVSTLNSAIFISALTFKRLIHSNQK